MNAIPLPFQWPRGQEYAPADGSVKASRADDGDASPAPSPLRRLASHLGTCESDIEAAFSAAHVNGSDAATELVSAGVASQAELGEAIASILSLPFAERIGADQRIIEEAGASERVVRSCGPDLVPRLHMAPTLENLDDFIDCLNRRAGDPRNVAITTPAAIRAFRETLTRSERSRQARLSFSARAPRLSARTVMSGGQGFVAAILLCLLCALAITDGSTMLAVLHISMSFFFASQTLQRILVVLEHDRHTRRSPLRSADPPGGRPIYTVLVALHDEAAMVEPLVRSLDELEWPKSRLDIKLVCEADDPETVSAVRQAIEGRPEFELVVVPPSLPRTKPKALNFALPLARGELLVLYDAEDRPHPGQLAEAWRAFRASDERLACLQAPLEIRHFRGNWFATLFALEYAVLFRAILPYLARHRLPLPLGGTSNHFRVAALLRAGGWDSHNVAEDADLGIRLSRIGYRTGVIRLPTFETAPRRWRDWRNQRTRWIKGWIQTWLVHMREPRRLFRELGPVSFLSFQVLFIGMIAGSIMHTLFAGYLALGIWRLLSSTDTGIHLNWLMVVDVFNIIAAWLVFGQLASRVANNEERAALPLGLTTIWGYWLLVSVAGLRAMAQLAIKPHHWEKTPHETEASAPQMAASRRRPASRTQARRRPAFLHAA